VRSVLNGNMTHHGSAQGEDVLLSEGRIVSEAHEPWEPQQRPFPTGHFDSRTAIFRAREAYRERVRAKSAAERHSAGVEAMIASPSVEDFVSPTTEETTAEPVNNVLQKTGAATTGELEVQTFEVNSWLREPTEAESPVNQPTLAAIEAVGWEEVAGGPAAFASESHFDGPEEEWQVTVTRDEQAGVPAPRTPSIEEADTARAGVEMTEREALPEWYRADLPRICRTCRDYRPSSDGQRGWCANTWAFTHRRLVLEDDPAPCQSAIGDWWLPVDDVWLVAADVSSHGRATPLLDRLTGKVAQRRRS
jgi:hypothetical protein